jgi:hypothetical protein
MWRWLPILVRCISGSPSSLVELGAAMMVASTMVSARISRPCSIGVDLLEQGLGAVVVQRQSSEHQQRGGIGHQLARQVDAHSVTQRLTIVRRVVGQAVPLLEAVHAQHPGNADRLPADSFARGVGWLDDCD